MMATIVEAMFVTVTPSLSIKRRTVPASKDGSVTCLAPTIVTEYTAKASTRWNMGATM